MWVRAGSVHPPPHALNTCARLSPGPQAPRLLADGGLLPSFLAWDNFDRWSVSPAGAERCGLLLCTRTAARLSQMQVRVFDAKRTSSALGSRSPGYTVGVPAAGVGTSPVLRTAAVALTSFLLTSFLQ